MVDGIQVRCLNPGLYEKSMAEMVDAEIRLFGKVPPAPYSDPDQSEPPTSAPAVTGPTPCKWCGSWDHSLINCPDGKPDPTNPPHYTDLSIEPIDFISAAGFAVGFCAGNAIKYLARFQAKGGIVDVRKARWYVDRLILELERSAKESAAESSESSD